MSQTETTIAEETRPARKFTIKVNDHPVVLSDHHQTGATIKAAAIDQGLSIEPDFELFEILPNGKQKQIDNAKKVIVKEGDEFWAIPGDDNS